MSLKNLLTFAIVGCSSLCLRASATAVCAGEQPALPEENQEFFERHVRPLLVAKCFECHGEEEPEGGLRLTSQAHVLKGGENGPAVIASKPEESRLLKAVLQTGTLKMPPNGKLTDSEISVLAKWIELGVPWPESVEVKSPHKEFSITAADREHWAFRPLTDPVLPTIRNETWPQTSIDRLILAKLEAEKRQPSAPADRRTLLRRASYDLIGLPPTWDATQEFLNDPAPTHEAFERIIDRLLDSPRYGERWGRHWLDVARFADTKDGVLMYGDDRIRPYAYTFRDYVIRAMNSDTPFDQFIREQLAADLIEPKVEPWRLAAMGFLTLGRLYDNNVHDIIDDQIDTVSRGFLGLTVACARCHDHKYDPVSTADYYSLYGVFASCEAPLELPLTASASSPDAEEFEKQAAAKRDEIRKFRDEQFTLLSETARQRVGDYLERVATTKPDPLETAIFFLSLAPEDLRPPVIARWRKYLDENAKPDDPVFGPWHDLMQLPLATENAEPGIPSSAPFAQPAAEVLEAWKSKPDGTQPGQINPLVRNALIGGTLTNRADVARVYGELLKQVDAESKSQVIAAGTSSEQQISEARAQLLSVISGPDSPTYFPKSQTRRYMSREQTDQYGGKLQELDRMAVQSPHAVPRAMGLVDAESPHDPRIFVRGNPTTLGKRVPRQFLELLSPTPATPFAHGSGRLELANAIASPSNPLTARVIVNRVWMQHFGEPLVATPSDFGKRSTPPVHMELLDHLAMQFIRDGWSLKKLHRIIMRSSVYQQASWSDAQAPTGIDYDNRFLSRMNRQRLTFEAMRDTLLAVSGRMELRDGGKPIDVTDPNSRCRTVFGMVDRQSLPGTFRAFDFASPDQSVERRPRTMVPQQALFALNSPFMIEQAKSLAARPESVAIVNSSSRITEIFHIVFQRDPTPDELAAAVEFVAAPKDDASELTVWEQFAQVLLSSNELMYVD